MQQLSLWKERRAEMLSGTRRSSAAEGHVESGPSASVEIWDGMWTASAVHALAQ